MYSVNIVVDIESLERMLIAHCDLCGRDTTLLQMCDEDEVSLPVERSHMSGYCKEIVSRVGALGKHVSPDSEIATSPAATTSTPTDRTGRSKTDNAISYAAIPSCLREPHVKLCEAIVALLKNEVCLQ
jgi:hypothetical protein